MSNTRAYLSNSRDVFTFDASDKSIKGSPYTSDGFLPAKLTIKNEDKIFSIRYNAYIDEMEVQLADKSISAVNMDLDSVRITFLDDNKTYQVVNYSSENEVKKGYFVNVNDYDSKIRLLSKESKRFVERKTASTSYEKTRPAHFSTLNTEFYIAIKDNTAQELPKRKKDIAKLIPEHSKDILSYIKTNKIKTSREEDLIKLVNYMSTL